jgi:hypothetical protein
MRGLGKKESTSFLKKRSKKLLLAVADSQLGRAKKQKFFGSFFQKRTFFLPSTSCPAAPRFLAQWSRA